jgi:hypothetical protein
MEKGRLPEKNNNSINQISNTVHIFIIKLLIVKKPYDSYLSKYV